MDLRDGFFRWMHLSDRSSPEDFQTLSVWETFQLAEVMRFHWIKIQTSVYKQLMFEPEKKPEKKKSY